MNIDDTIAAIATPAGEGGIGIIRLSGPDARSILDGIFVRGKTEEAAINPRELTYGYIKDRDKDQIIDEVLVAYMPAPATYTREEVVEINCHGGMIPLSKTLQLVIRNGARMAEPGEFTKRAFLNGRLDLSQAEAVLDIINAKTDSSLSVAISQLQGNFSMEIERLRNRITDILVEIDVNIDYPDEDIETLTYKKIEEQLNNILEDLRQLLESASSGKILREGLNIAIIGRPNAGKSSLLNALLKEKRAIVTDIPGTTRDTIEEFANIKGIPVKLTDTAGIRESDDEIEKIGIERTRESLKNSDLAILMVDISERPDDQLQQIIDSTIPEKTILVFNKKDKEHFISDKKQDDLIENNGRRFAIALKVSLTSEEEKGNSIREIENAIFDLSGYSSEILETQNRSMERSRSIVSNLRHKTMLERAANSIEDGLTAVRQKAPLEIIEIDVRSAYEELGFITGDSVQDDIIDQIFSRFCLGK